MTDVAVPRFALSRDPAVACTPEVAVHFHPPSGLAHRHQRLLHIHAAKALCRVCPLRWECLDWALDNPEDGNYGIWGGTTPRERQNMLRKPHPVDHPRMPEAS